MDQQDKEHTMMRSTPRYAPEDMTSAGRYAERFDDGLVHNHHWAVTSDEAYPTCDQGPGADGGCGRILAGETSGETWREPAPIQSHGMARYDHDRHDDGLVHNHDWAVSGN
jgi:hypothetical protein